MATWTGRTTGRLGDRRGVAAGLIVLMLFAFVGMAALSVDLGILLAARTEAQRSADAGALSGALSLKEVPGDIDRARQMAIASANANRVHGVSNDVLTGDVDVELTDERVRVRVIRSAIRNSAIANLFARVLGFETSDISAEAAAHVAIAGGVNCPLPFALVDRWWEASSNDLASQADDYDPLAGDVYNEGPRGDVVGPTLPTGYGEADRGTILSIYPPDPNSAPMPGWAFQLDLANGGMGVRQWIQGCVNPDLVFSYGDSIQVEQGMDVGNVNLGFDSLMALDPTAYWGIGPATPPSGCVLRPGVVNEDGELACVSSPRLKPTFLISPEDIADWDTSTRQGGGPGNGGSGGGGGGQLKTVTLRNFVGLFVLCRGTLDPVTETCSQSGGQNPVHVKFVEYTGVEALPPSQNTGSLVKVLQLVE